MKFFPRLHWLRGLLALAVVASHLTHLVSASDSNPLLRCGTAAVPVFFVLSGFVMYQVVAGSGVGFKPAAAFLIKRVLRIFPAYWFFLALTLFFITSGHATWDRAENPHVDWTAGWALLSLQGEPWLPMAVSWSLIFEMIFYYALTCLVLNRTFGVVVLILYFGWSLFLHHWSPVQIDGLYPIAGLFLAGLALGAANRHVPKLVSKFAPLILPGLALALGYIFAGFTLHGAIERLAAVFIVAGILGLEHSYRPRLHFSIQRPLQFLGTISFSLYVGHTLTQSALGYLVGIPTLWTAPLFLGAPILVAFCSFRLVEKPSMDFARWIDLKFVPPRALHDLSATKELEPPGAP